MALPENVVDQLTREPVQTPGWPLRLIFAASGVFVASLLAFAGLTYAWLPYVQSQTDQLRSQVQAFTSKIPTTDAGTLENFYSQLSNVKTLLDKHIAVSPVFAWLEKNTDQNIYFTKFNLGLANGERLVLDGIAKSPDDVADQNCAAFQKLPQEDFLFLGILNRLHVAQELRFKSLTGSYQKAFAGENEAISGFPVPGRGRAVPS